MATTTKNWSGDQDFLFDVAVLRRRFMDTDINQDLYGMVTSLKLLFYVCEPKLLSLNPKIEADNIKWIEDRLGATVYIDGVSGRQVQTDGTRYNTKILMDKCEEVFRSLLVKLQKAGIYTRNTTDPKDVLGNFEGS